MGPIRVLIVDDSSVVRQLLTEILSEAPDLEVVGAACDPLVARDKIKLLSPDVITLDVEMPRMDGLTFLSNLMRLRPMPVVMISTLTEKGAQTTMRALELGAVDFIPKPQNAQGLREYSEELRQKVRAAARARLASRTTPPAALALQPASPLPARASRALLALGASTGGVEALGQVFTALPQDGPGAVVVQHIPDPFAAAFVQRIDLRCQRTVELARHGQTVLDGHIYLAPGNQHLRVVPDGTGFRMQLTDEDKVSGHRPSVDVLFESVAAAAGPRACGALLTGMGHDGAAGLLRMRQAGASTMAQDEASCVVYGMPREAVRIGAAQAVVGLEQVAPTLMSWALNSRMPGR